MKILFVAQNFHMGGIQKALIHLLKELVDQEQFELEVFSFGKGLLLKELPESIQLTTGGLLLSLVATPWKEVIKRKNVIYIMLRLVCMLVVRFVGSDAFYRMLFKRNQLSGTYDIAISYFNDVQGGYFNKGTNIYVQQFVQAKKKIAWVHTDPMKACFDYKTTKKTYEPFDRIVCVSEACKRNFIQLVPEFEQKTTVIHNLFPIDEIQQLAKERHSTQQDKLNIISIGRIDNFTKRFHLIPQLCKQLKEVSITNFHWKVVGDGPHLKEMRQLIVKLGVSELVEFVGEYKNPYPLLKASDLFILTSSYEGYPMVIGEALILQIPVITTNFAAASELIIHNQNGLITSTELDDLYTVIEGVLVNKEKIIHFKNFIIDHPYSNEKALEQLALEFG